MDGPHHEVGRVIVVALLAAAATGSAVSATVARRAHRAAVHGRLPADPSPPGRRVGVAVRRWAAVIVSVAALVIAPVPAVVVLASVAVRPVIRDRRRADGADRAALATMPEAIDLLAVAARAGLPAPSCVAAVAERAPPPWDDAFAAVLGRTASGERFVVALDELVRVGGDAAHPLRSVLRSAADGDLDLTAGLDRVGVDARDARRRRAEEAARRIPVRLLLPLVACSLPAFALLSIVPIVAGAVQALDL